MMSFRRTFSIAALLSGPGSRRLRVGSSRVMISWPGAARSGAMPIR